MNSLATAAIIFGCSFGAGLLGMVLNVILPDNHLDTGSKDVVKLVMGLIATMSALVLSLLIASGSSSYQAQQNEVQSLAANVVLLDRTLSFYGPGAREPRDLLRQGVAAVHDRIWSPDGERRRRFRSQGNTGPCRRVLRQSEGTCARKQTRRTDVKEPGHADQPEPHDNHGC